MVSAGAPPSPWPPPARPKGGKLACARSLALARVDCPACAPASTSWHDEDSRLDRAQPSKALPEAAPFAAGDADSAAPALSFAPHRAAPRCAAAAAPGRNRRDTGGQQDAWDNDTRSRTRAQALIPCALGGSDRSAGAGAADGAAAVATAPAGAATGVDVAPATGPAVVDAQGVPFDFLGDLLSRCSSTLPTPCRQARPVLQRSRALRSTLSRPSRWTACATAGRSPCAHTCHSLQTSYVVMHRQQTSPGYRVKFVIRITPDMQRVCLRVAALTAAERTYCSAA